MEWDGYNQTKQPDTSTLDSVAPLRPQTSSNTSFRRCLLRQGMGWWFPSYGPDLAGRDRGTRQKVCRVEKGAIFGYIVFLACVCGLKTPLHNIWANVNSLQQVFSPLLFPAGVGV